MRKISTRLVALVIMIMALSANILKAQTVEELIDLLIQKQIIKQNEADSIRADIALKEQSEKDKSKPFAINSNNPIQIMGYTQVRYQSFQTGSINSFDLRRVRLDLKGAIGGEWDYRLQTDFASSPKIIDAYLNYSFEDYLKVTTGQFKIPFSMENLIPDERSESIDRAQVVEAMVARSKDVIGNQNGRDIGLQFSGNVASFNNGFLFDYALGVFDGAGINTADNNQAKDFAGRLVLHPVSGLDLGGSYYNGYDQWNISVKDNTGKTVTALRNQSRVRYGSELKYKIGALTLSSEYISGNDGVIKRDGWYAQLTYFLISNKLQALLKMDEFDPDKSKSNVKLTNYTVGINYGFTNWAKIQTQYVYRREQTTQINNDALAFQLQLSF